MRNPGLTPIILATSETGEIRGGVEVTIWIRWLGGIHTFTFISGLLFSIHFGLWCPLFIWYSGECSLNSKLNSLVWFTPSMYIQYSTVQYIEAYFALRITSYELQFTYTYCTLPRSIITYYICIYYTVDSLFQHLVLYKCMAIWNRYIDIHTYIHTYLQTICIIFIITILVLLHLSIT